MKDNAVPLPPQKALDEALRVDFSSRYLLVEGIGECPVPLFVIDHEHVITLWNKALVQLTGLSEAEMVGTRDHWKAFYPFERPTIADLTVDGTVEQKIDVLYQGKYQRSPMLEGGFELSDFFPNMGEDGRWLYFMAAPLRDPSGRTIGAIEILQDVTTSNHAEAMLREDQSFFKQIVDGSSVPTFVIDREHRVTHWNRACEVVTEIGADELIGTRNQWRPFYDSERPVMADLILSHALEKDVDQFYHGKFRSSQLIDGAFEAEDYFPHLGEQGKWLFFTAAPLSDASGKFIGAIETLQDITAQKQAELSLRASEEQFRLMSITDGLTSLYNARHFYQQIEIEIKRAVRHVRPLSLLLIDLDDFKKLNDVHGHLEGDRALAATAEVIKRSFRDLDTTYRYGGEEFAVLLPDTNIVPAKMLAERLLKTLANTPLTTVAGDVVNITASIGVAEYDTAETAKSFVRRADDGVYEAKRQGKNCVAAVLSTSTQAAPLLPTPQATPAKTIGPDLAPTATGKPVVLIVDDTPDNITLMYGLLKDLYTLQVANSGEKAIRIARGDTQPDLILLDIMMPGLSGYEVCRQLKDDPLTRDIPIIFLTAMTAADDEKRGLEMGGVDYIAKPIRPPIFLSRVQTQIKIKASTDLLRNLNTYLDGEVAKRTREVVTIQDVTIFAMASLAETRDNETGNHIRRAQYYVKSLAEGLQSHPRFCDFLSDHMVNILFKSAPLHDIGKVGIPDHILLKPGRLDPAEFEIMKTHALLGRESIQHAEDQLGTDVEFLKHAKDIAYGHHEKWDGSGYPEGTVGNDIPVSARLMAVADVYDALISRRVYKEAMSHERAVQIINEGRGTHFDPDIADAFIELEEEFRTIAESFPDSDA